MPGPIGVVAPGWKAHVYHGLACSKCSVSRVRCSDDGKRVKVFRYSFSEAIPIFFNRLKSGFFLVRLL